MHKLFFRIAIILLPSLFYCNLAIALIITEDTTWTVDNSPYLLTENIQIASNVTLTVEAGVEISGISGGSIQAFGILLVQGEVNNPVLIHDVELSVSKEGASYGHLNIDHAHITNTKLYRGASSSNNKGKLTLTNSIIQDNPLIYLWYPTDDCLFEGNIFINSGRISVGTDGGVQVTIRNNFFYAQTDDVAIENWASYGSSSTNVEFNSFVSTDRTAVKLKYDSGEMLAQNNYWGTTDENVIQQMIYDRNDTLDLSSTIEYSPYLVEHDVNTPNPVSEDRDSDSLTDFVELTGQTSMYSNDTDGDGVLDADDAFPLDATESLDTDGDRIGNNADTDDDGDGVLDADDAFPLDSTKSASPTPTEPTKNSGGGGGSTSLFMLLIFTLTLLPRKFIKHKNQ